MSNIRYTHQEIQNKYAKNVLLAGRNSGAAQKLAGDITVTVFLVNDSCSTWTPTAEKTYIARHNAAMQKLMYYASCRSIRLNIRCVYEKVSVTVNASYQNCSDWTTQIIRQYGPYRLLEYQKRCKQKYSCTEAPLVFAFNKKLLCYAAPAYIRAPFKGEYSVNTSGSSVDTIMHELLHQFGACDLYYPRELRDLVAKMGYLSIMAIGNTDLIDPLTAYLIGWTDCLPPDVIPLLEIMEPYSFDAYSKLSQAEYTSRC